MKIVNWNIEWMNHWFRGNSNPTWGSNSLEPEEVDKIAKRVANVINSLSPDIICVQEGPSSAAEMQLFLDTYLPANGDEGGYEFVMGSDGAAQKLYVLRKLNGKAASIDFATDDLSVEMSEAWEADVDGDLILEPYDFTRMPLVVDVDPHVGPPIRVVVLHTKSKYVHNGKALFSNPDTKQIFITRAMLARRRISAEAFRLRTYLDSLLKDNLDARIIVTGDFNDGPGRDYFERSYLTHNVTDIILGSSFYPQLIFHHAILPRTSPASLFTARFDDYVDDVRDRPLLLDHFIVSPSLQEKVEDAAIEHEVFENEIANDGSSRIDRPSDHRPISLTLK